MSWMLKVKMLERTGLSHEDAMVRVITDLAESNRLMDIRLAKCLEVLPDDQIAIIFGDIHAGI